MIGTSTLNHSKSIIRYHDPYTRLNLRAKLEHVIQNNPKFHHINVIDIFPILDAIIKRGGCERVKSRMEQILLSLPYFDTNLIKKSIQMISSLQKEQQFQPIIASIQYISQPFIQQHLLPATSGQGYYQLTKQQTTFARQNFSHIDEYLTIKSLAYFGVVFSKIGNAYLQKYYKLRRWLYINDLITNDVKDEQFIAINKLSQSKENMYMQMNMNMGVPIANPYKYPQRVCVVGLTLANLIMSIKLSKLGYYVKMVERNYENLFKWSAGNIPDLIRQGIYLNNELQANRLNEILLNYVGASCEPVDESEQNSKKIKQIKDSLLRYQPTFLILLEQILRECPKNAGKLFWQQMHHRIMTINNNFQYRNKSCRINERIDLDGIRMYFERFIMLNKIKDESIVTVGDIKRFIEQYYMAEQPLALYNNLIYRNSKTKMSINNTPYFLKPQKMNLKKYQQIISKDKITNSNLNLNICLDSQVKKIEYKQNTWQITMMIINENKIFVQQFTHLIYSESQSIQKSIKQRYFLPQLANPINFPILQQLNYHSQIHCLYRFTESIEFRGTNNKSIFTFYCSQVLGTINFYLLPSKCEVFACLRKSIKYPTIDYYRQIYNILYDHILKNNPKLEYPKESFNENIEQCRYFSLKDENMLDSIIKLREKENMYLSVPIICMYGNNPKNIVQNQMRINNKIINLICNSQNLYLRRVQKAIHPTVMPMQMPRGPLPMSYNSIPSYVTPHKQVIPNVSNMPIGNMHIGMGMGMNMAPIQINPYHLNVYEEQNKTIKKPVHEDLFVKKKDIDETKIVDIEKSEKKDDKMDIQESSQSAEIQNRQNISSIKVKENVVLLSIQKCEIINKVKQLLWVSTQQITRYMALLSISNQANSPLQSSVPHFSINIPLPISNSLYVINWGLPSLSSLQIEYKDVFYQNMIILSVSKSLINPSEQVIFYHACILYEDVPFYCMIQMDNHITPQPNTKEGCLNILLFFHTSLQELNKCMGEILKQSENNESNIGQEYKKILKNKQFMIGFIEKGISSQFKKYKKNERAPLDRKRKQQYFTIKCNEILKTKIEKIQKQNNQKDNMQQQNEQLFTKLQYSTADLINIIFSQSDRYANYLCGLYRLRPYSLGDIFMGKLNLKYIVSEIEDNFDKQNTENEIKETQAMIACLKQEIKKYKLGSYPLGIYKNQSIVIKRKFIDIDEQGYLILQQLNYSPTIDDLNPYPCSNKWNKESNGKWIKSIIQRLVQAQYPLSELIQHLNKLVRQQMQQIINIINMSSSASHRKIFNYFAITRMDFNSHRIYKRNQAENRIVEKSGKRLQKLKEQIEKEYKMKQNQSMQSTVDEQLDQISDMIHQRNVIFDGNQIFASFYS